MLSRTVRKGQVCLQCRLRLLDQSRPVRLPRLQQALVPNSQLRSRRLYSSESSWERLQTASSDKKPESRDKGDSSFRNDPNDTATTIPTITSSPADNDLDASAPESQPKTETTQRGNSHGRKERGHHGRVGSRRVVLEPEELGIDMLGQKAHTIVMRDEKSRKPRREIQEEPLQDDVSRDSASEIQAAIEAAEADASSEEAFKNIDELQPSGTRALPEAEFWALYEKLVDGFTSQQLRDYQKQKQRSYARRSEPRAESSVQVRLGVPCTIIPLGKFEPPGGVAIKAKQRRALSVMEEAWKLKIWERVEGLSLVSLKIRDKAVAAILASGRSNTIGLGQLRNRYLQQGETLDFDSATSTLQIVANRPAIETVLDEVDKIASSVKEEKFKLFVHEKSQETPNPPSNVASDPPLADLECMTGAIHSVDPKQRELSVTYAGEGIGRTLGATSSTFETLGHITWRLLYTAYMNTDTTVLLGSKLLPDSSHSDILDTSYVDLEKLPWKDRLRHWGRLTLPVGRDVTPRGSSNDELAQDILRSSQAVVPRSNTDAGATSPWGPPETTDTATFGHVLFEDGPLASGIPDGMAAAARGQNSALTPADTESLGAHTFTSVTPPPHGLKPLNKLLPASIDQQPATRTTVTFRFAALPEANPSRQGFLSRSAEDGSVALHPASRSPAILELRLEAPPPLSADNTSDAYQGGPLTWQNSTHKQVRAVTGTHRADVSLPDRPVDMRVATQTSRALNANLDSLPSLQAFVDACHLDIASGTLRTPPRLELTDAGSVSALHDELVGETPKKKRHAHAPWLDFIGLEVRTEANFSYGARGGVGGDGDGAQGDGTADDGLKVVYADVEAGLHGGRRAELSLVAPGWPTVSPGMQSGPDDVDVVTRRARFIQSALDIVDGALVRWEDGRREGHYQDRNGKTSTLE